MTTVAEVLDRVDQLNLEPISRVLKHENPDFWTDDILQETEADYRRLFALHLLYPAEPIVVNAILDDYWHHHILDTKKYAEDCEVLFGHFLHHDPYFGIDGPEDRQRNLEAFAATQELWEDTFGFPMVREWTPVLDKVLGSYQEERTGIEKNRVYAFPQTCKCGQHCKRTIVPDTRINPLINPAVNPQINPQIRPPLNPRLG